MKQLSAAEEAEAGDKERKLATAAEKASGKKFDRLTGRPKLGDTAKTWKMKLSVVQQVDSALIHRKITSEETHQHFMPENNGWGSPTGLGGSNTASQKNGIRRDMQQVASYLRRRPPPLPSVFKLAYSVGFERHMSTCIHIDVDRGIVVIHLPPSCRQIAY
ncbi:hypothetical protein CDD83_9971 [Cordyceps sp. RAO-2017]|nr:hypothetical protein CDD83_9971 [Cordyceps sp. RAO-2017]